MVRRSRAAMSMNSNESYELSSSFNVSCYLCSRLDITDRVHYGQIWRLIDKLAQNVQVIFSQIFWHLRIGVSSLP